MTFTILFKLPVPGCGCNSASFNTSRTDANLVYCYEDDDGNELQGYISFKKAVAFRFSNEAHAVNPIKQAYDSVLVSDDSDWLCDAKARVPEGNKWPFERRHFMVNVSNTGYYEVIAEECIAEETIRVPS